jgi:hypothetical protein
MQEQIRSLEKKINDLRFHYGGEEGERLATELRHIEHNILQQEREMKLVRVGIFISVLDCSITPNNLLFLERGRG